MTLCLSAVRVELPGRLSIFLFVLSIKSKLVYPMTSYFHWLTVLTDALRRFSSCCQTTGGKACVISKSDKQPPVDWRHSVHNNRDNTDSCLITQIVTRLLSSSEQTASVHFKYHFYESDISYTKWSNLFNPKQDEQRPDWRPWPNSGMHVTNAGHANYMYNPSSKSLISHVKLANRAIACSM